MMMIMMMVKMIMKMMVKVINDHDGDDDLNPDQSELGAKVRMWVECLQRSNSLCLLVILMFRFP